jgi:hypothetical protein
MIYSAEFFTVGRGNKWRILHYPNVKNVTQEIWYLCPISVAKGHQFTTKPGSVLTQTVGSMLKYGMGMFT